MLHVIVGSTSAREHMKVIERNGWGRMFIERKPTPYPGERWGFDNGAFVAWRRGEPFPTVEYQRRLDRAYAIGTPYLAVLPDIVAGGERSLDFSLHWLDRVPREWPWFLAVQDGMCTAAIETVVDNVSGLFLGGTDVFKSTALDWSELAHAHGKLFHYARAGTRRKMWLARYAAADSIDSAFPLWTRERLEAFERWWHQGEAQRTSQLSLPFNDEILGYTNRY